MFNSLKTAVFAGLIGLASQAVAPVQAGVLADSATRFLMGQSSDTRVQEAAGRTQQRCMPQDALDKAAHIGIRRASVVYVRLNSIGVTGLLHGNRIDVKFSRGPNCPVLHLD